MIEYVELELLKAVRCEKCGNILLWKGNIAGRSMAFFDEEMIKDLQNLIHCTEQDEYGDDTKELKICDLHNIYDLEKKIFGEQQGTSYNSSKYNRRFRE